MFHGCANTQVSETPQTPPTEEKETRTFVGTMLPMLAETIQELLWAVDADPDVSAEAFTTLPCPKGLRSIIGGEGKPAHLLTCPERFTVLIDTTEQAVRAYDYLLLTRGICIVFQHEGTPLFLKEAQEEKTGLNKLSLVRLSTFDRLPPAPEPLLIGACPIL